VSIVLKTNFQEVKNEISQLKPELANNEICFKLSSIFSLLSTMNDKDGLKGYHLLQLRDKLFQVVNSISDSSEATLYFDLFNEYLCKAIVDSSVDPFCVCMFFGKNNPSYAYIAFSGSPSAAKILKQGELVTLADVKVLEFIDSQSIPCHYNPEIRAIVPSPKAYSTVQSKWRELRDPIRDIIGTIESEQTSDPRTWQNSAKSVDELLEDEKAGAGIFLDLAEQIAKASGGTAHFGPGNINITKSRASIFDKVSRITNETGSVEAYAIGQIEDGVRGTISFKTPQELKKGLEAFKSQLIALGLEADISNIWKNEFDYSGYLDVDAKIRIKLPSEGPNSEPRYVMGEIQFHLEDFYDGGKDCVVSRAHKVYEIIRLIPVKGGPSVNMTFDELNETSRLYFTTALFQAHKKFE
jgi:hypothetical protein